jgi:hypothetical protein
VSLSPNIGTSQITIAQRWQKLYRTIFNKFLKKDFVHIKDFKLFEQQLNAKLASIETTITASITATNANISLSILGHNHIGNLAAPTGPGIPLAPVPAVPTPPTPAVNIRDTFAQQQDAIQQATGPALAPLGDGISPEAQKASITITKNIGAN